MEVLQITEEMKEFFLGNNNFTEELQEKFGKDYLDDMSEEELCEEIKEAIQGGDLLYFFPEAREAVEAVEENYRFNIKNVDGFEEKTAWSEWGYNQENEMLPTPAEHIADIYELDFDRQTEFYLNLCAKMNKTL